MTPEQLDLHLTERCNTLLLKQKAFDSLELLLLNHSEEKNFLSGFERNEIRPVFDGYEFHVGKRYATAVIRTRIGLYVDDKQEVWLDRIEPIGYYELETDFNGEALDDWFIIEKGKYLKDIDMNAHIQALNEKRPHEYLRRDHIQHDFVTCINYISTLFISREFEDAGQFIRSAYTHLKSANSALMDRQYLKESKRFLKMMTDYLVTNNLLTGQLKAELKEITTQA